MQIRVCWLQLVVPCLHIRHFVTLSRMETLRNSSRTVVIMLLGIAGSQGVMGNDRELSAGVAVINGTHYLPVGGIKIIVDCLEFSQR